MKSEIKAAIEESISMDQISHVAVDAADIYDAFHGVDYDDAIEIEKGIFDVWGNLNGNDWRIEVELLKEEI